MTRLLMLSECKETGTEKILSRKKPRQCSNNAEG